ncbi:unnamed protein product (macronuclear) [Paramecium tetraurelia]|uniref:EGF-like domain-containing protein n=1 Tax=Paramecium tetraurelia TaxID=5888 RepID=A0BX59_PARTE|nr:uncharacterized protein GSPATT00032978001 [Paramecium tetraurelia]CAK63126.1 unnamed protein product [Paramecium tetraurelia]|eukprot:XP_001430524.1 hypothetical protein (macronuclear) [Paramecium tetraurelia strain d4-2]
MIQACFAIILYMNCIIKVFGVREVVSTSFQEITFSDADNWVVNGAQPKLTKCSGYTLFGGYSVFGPNTVVAKTFALPPHYMITLQFGFYRIDSWDNQNFTIVMDGHPVRQIMAANDGSFYCGNQAMADRFYRFNIDFYHTSPSVVIQFKSNLTRTAYYNSWGIREIILFVEKCPERCIFCDIFKNGVSCLALSVFYKSWTQLNATEISSDGWNVYLGIAESTSCGSVALFGGYKKIGANTVLKQSFYNIPNHNELWIEFFFAKIGLWENIYLYLIVDGVLRSKLHSWEDGGNGFICEDSPQSQKTWFYRVRYYISHTSSQLDISIYIKNNISGIIEDDSIGIRDFLIYYNDCPEGTYRNGTYCYSCNKSCFKCDGPNLDDCTDCGDPIRYQKQLVAGQCTCLARMVEYDNIDGTTSCQTCHPKCQRCFMYFDNTVNQYCTMCIAGQNRVVSSQYMCVCGTGYGEDGISEVCFKCYYTCLHCNGLLANNCTTCSSQSNRILTSDSQCLCNQGYFDTGINEIICEKNCHNTCSSCASPSADQCTSCPVTRKPDRIGTTFGCLCNDSHKYSDDTQSECQECHFTCKTCYGAEYNNCLTCDENAFRNFSMRKCICSGGYYGENQLQCLPCHYTCLTCFGPAENNCLTCADSNNRVLKTNLCLCRDITYMQKQIGDAMCYKCSYRCSSCSNEIENCTACPPQSYRDLGVDNSCSCLAKMYDQPNNPICIPCHYTCLTCNGPQSNQCTACYAEIMRVSNQSGSCLCMDKYYEAGKPDCLPCSANCLTCVNSADNCISCKSDRYLQGNTCICQNKITGALISKYEVKGKTDCCHYSCLECYGSEFNQCTKCLDRESRILSNSTCVCAGHYFDIGQPKCKQCQYTCETCGMSTTCLTCAPNTFRTLSISRCICQQGYFDDGSNPICQKCHYSCSYCSSISTKCDTCSSTSNRVINPSIFTCDCVESYYDNGVETCSKCHYSCLACNQFGNQFCHSCKEKSISFRVFNQGFCQCLPGYFDDGVSPVCQKCLISCLTCLNTATYCTSCESTRNFEGNSCICKEGYFEKNQISCGKCDQNCLNCSIKSNMCTKCDQSLMRILNNVTQTCVCKTGTTEINGQCQYCDITCDTCSNLITNCTSCKSLRFLSSNKCNCIDGTYESSSDKQCLYCNKTCKTCIKKENYCTSCSDDLYRIFSSGNICVCKNGYYEDSVSLDCKPCDSSCLTCNTQPTYCLTCNAKYNLSLNVYNKCVCSTGLYFNSLSLKCEACNIKCLECKQQQECIECEQFTRYFDPDKLECPCKDGYYEVNAKTCQLCDYGCKTCQTSATKCLSCEALYYRFLNFNKCICLDGYYDIGIEMCQQCDTICLTCQKSSTQCTSCNQTQHFRSLSLNQCICQSGYYDIGQLVCQKCSNQCLTCTGQKDFCTSCDILQQRIDQSIINKCPCLKGFYQDVNDQCQKCHYKCQTCVQQNDNCLICTYSKTSNRLNISNNCICKDGYYDNNLQLDCQKCSPQCKLCQNSSNNCLTCYGDLRQEPPTCNCKHGFFETILGFCEPCENQCYNCDKSPSNCLSCKEGRVTQLCICQEGYYEIGQPQCDQCSFQCQTCKNSAINCLSCKGDRINMPICSCPDGFYDDYLNYSCQVCNWLCQTCNLNGCLICKANRILSPEMTCDQPLDSVSYPDTPWCSTCQVAVLNIRFSDDLLSIQVKFDFPLNPSFFINQFQENICSRILKDQTYQLLGKNPNCYIDSNDDTIIMLGVGKDPKILLGDLILFQENQIGHQGCDSLLIYFIFNEIKSPLNPVSPILIYDEPTQLINPCDDNIIPLKSILNDGLRSLIEIKWTYFVIGSNGKGNIDNFIASQTKYQILELVIPIQTLPKQSNITFEIEFKNFVAEFGVKSIRFQTHSGLFPTILWVSKPIYYTFEPIAIEFKIKKKVCLDTDATQVDKSQYSLSLIEVHKNDSNSRSSRVNYSEITSQNSFIVTIEKYILTPMVAYTFEQTTNDLILNFSTKKNITLEISSGGIMCQFNGTKKIQNFRKDTQIFISCKDLDTQYDWNQDPNIEIDINCVDFNRNSLCVDLQNKIIHINKTDPFQVIPKYTISPYTIQCWTVVAKKLSRSFKFQVKIVYIDQNFELLNVTYSQGYLKRPVNNYENLEFTINIPFQDRQYLLEYQVAIIYNFELIRILQSEYFQFQFNIFDQFQKFSEGNTINLKFLAQFTNEIIPCQEDLQLTVNLPPSCTVSLSEQIVQALKPQKIISNCLFSNAAPFTYQLRYFLHNQDLIDFLSRKNDYSLILSPYSSSNIMEGSFPFSDGFLLIQAMDSKGSYSNIQRQLNITQIVLNCSQINIQQYPLRYQISLLLEVILNHQDQQNCIDFSQQLYSYIKAFLNAEDDDDQFLVYQTVKVYKRIIRNRNNLNTSKRLLEDKQESCFQNSSKSFYVQSTLFNNSSFLNASSLQADLQYIMDTVQKMIKKLTDIKDQINKNDLFLNEKLYQSKVATLESLLIAQLLIDDIYLKIPMANINSTLDKEKIFQIAEGLIGLFEVISMHVNDYAKVNGPPLINDGEIIKWKLSKITKVQFNKQFNIERDQLDELIEFVQKEQIELNYNYLNLSQQLQTQLQDFYNVTTIKIYEKKQQRVYLQNHLYNNRSLHYQDPLTTYIIDMIQIPYCQEQVPLEKLYTYECVNINLKGQLFKCDFITEEIDNKTMVISCRCQKLGSIFLIQYHNNSALLQNDTFNPQENRIDNSNEKLDQQPILLFHGIFIVFSYLIYYELLQIEMRSKQLQIESRLETENSVDPAFFYVKTQQIIFYPGNFALFKKYFKFIHEVLSCFYMDDPILPKSYRFLQLSIKISIFILFSFLQLTLIDIFPISIISFANCGIYLLIRMILKIFQSIYRFGGKCSNSVIIFYLLIHFLCYLGLVLQLKQWQI